MNRILDTPMRNPFPGPTEMSTKTRTVPLISSTIPPSDSTQGDPMEVSPSTSTTMAPPGQNSPEIDQGQAHNTNGASGDLGLSQGTNQPIGAAAAAQQPKVVQTAFIHKLYSMLQDPTIQHLISWSSSNESFVMSPSSDFSKVLSQYFKHTNISSFVRQLNMYGFHKVSDVFHTGSPDSPMWEFRHGNGSFRKGDVAGLRDIKRRASRHALIHRDSFSNHKPNASQPGTPAEPIPDGQENNRVANLEQSLYEVHSRLARMEDQHSLLNSRCQVLTESLTRCHQWANSMSTLITSIVPDPESGVHRDASNLQREVARQLEYVRALEPPQDTVTSGKQQYFSNLSLDTGPPLSPRQAPQDDGRRASTIRHQLPTHLSVSPHRHGSIGATSTSPNYPRPPPAMQQPASQQQSSVPSPLGPNMGRRHTSADIRQHGWPAPVPPGTSAFGPGAPPPQWPPSSPSRTANSSDQHVRDALARYELGGPRRQQDSSRLATPPLSLDPVQPESGWSIGGPKFPRPVESLPATRRSSMASNVHSLLNPADTAERADEDEPPMAEERKRKRLL